TCVVTVCRRGGVLAGKAPVSGNGLRKGPGSGKSPKPLPKQMLGESVEKESAPIERAPVPPTSAVRPNENSASERGIVMSWYLAPTSRLPKPFCVLPPSGFRCRYDPPSDSPRLGVSRLVWSTENSVNPVGGPPPSSGS